MLIGHIKRRNIKGGDFLFGERLQMAQILRDNDKPEIERIKDIIECLHGFRPSTYRAAIMRDYAIDIANDFVAWINRENEECSVSPLPEAQRAGIEEFSRNVGDSATVANLAERFHIMPLSRVYELPYLDVFCIWKVDAESAKFERRLKAVREAEERKHKKR